MLVHYSSHSRANISINVILSRLHDIHIASPGFPYSEISVGFVLPSRKSESSLTGMLKSENTAMLILIKMLSDDNTLTNTALKTSPKHWNDSEIDHKNQTLDKSGVQSI